MPFLATGSLIALPMGLVFGLPMYLLFRRLGWLAWWQVILGASSAACIGVMAMFVMDSESVSLPGLLTVACPLGALAGGVFWLVACAGTRPDDSSEPNSVLSGT